MHHKHIDKLAFGQSPIHSLDARVKLIFTLVFTVLVITIDKRAVSPLFLYLVAPFALLTIGGIKLSFVFKQILIVSPFIIALALAGLFYDTQPMKIVFGNFQFTVSSGLLRFFNITGKFIITVSALMALVCTTKFSQILITLQWFKCPQIIVMELAMLYRYIFLLIESAGRILRARNSRKLRNLGFKQEFKTASAMLSRLFINSVETSKKVNLSMASRGFDGMFRSVYGLKIQSADFVFITAASIYVIIVLIITFNM